MDRKFQLAEFTHFQNCLMNPDRAIVHGIILAAISFKDFKRFLMKLPGCLYFTLFTYRPVYIGTVKSWKLNLCPKISWNKQNVMKKGVPRQMYFGQHQTSKFQAVSHKFTNHTKSFSRSTILLGVKNYQIKGFFWSKICVIKSQKSLRNTGLKIWGGT